MAEQALRRNIDIIDILFAVAIGTGFEVGLFEMRAEIATLRILDDPALAQHLARLVLAFTLVTISWFVYRASSSGARPYGGAEFVIDVLVYFTYLPLFMFVEHPAAFYATIAAVWVLYAASQASARDRTMTSALAPAVFVVLFLALCGTAAAFPGAGAEWARIAAALAGIVGYRIVQRAAAKRRAD